MERSIRNVLYAAVREAVYSGSAEARDQREILESDPAADACEPYFAAYRNAEQLTDELVVELVGRIRDAVSPIG